MIIISKGTHGHLCRYIMRLLPTLTLTAKQGSCRPLLQLVQPQVQLNHYNNLLILCKVRLFTLQDRLLLLNRHLKQQTHSQHQSIYQHGQHQLSQV
jgi:hypothetical protein